MIRRGFWLLTGAVLGVSGYRKVTRLTRALTEPGAVAPRPGGTRGGVTRGGGPRAGGPTAAARVAAAAGFVRDVRSGMAEYRDLHRGEQDRMLTGRNLESQGDSREDRIGARGGRSGAVTPGAGQRDHREP